MRSITLIFLLLGQCAQGIGQRQPSMVNPNGETKVSTSISETKLVAILQTTEVEISTDDKVPRFPQCTYSRTPCVIVRQIKLFVNRAEIFLPRSIYADLSDVQSAEFSRAKDGKFILTITGGDASESYIARIIFDRQVQQRMLYSGEDRTHALEVTNYHQVASTD